MSVETKIDWNELDKEANEDASKQATDELKKFEEAKQKEQKERSETTRRMVEAFSDCG